MSIIVKVDEDKNVAVIPRDNMVFPNICAICLEPTSDTIKIKGGVNKGVDLALAMVSACYYVYFTFPVCKHCQRSEKLKYAFSFILGGVVMTLGGVLMGLAKHNAVMTFVGLGAVVFSPIIAWIYALYSMNKPQVLTFDKDTITVKFRSLGYSRKFIEFCREDGIEVEINSCYSSP